MPDGVRRAFGPVDEHDQRRLREGGQIGIHDPHPVFQRRQLAVLRSAQVPLAPPADGTEIQMVEVGVAVIPLAEPLDQVKVGVQDDRIVHIRDRKRALPSVVRHKNAAADLREPVGMIREALVGRAAHHPECQLLPGVVRLLEHPVEEVIGDLPGLRFQFPPAPSGVVDSRRNPRRQVLVRLAGVMERLPAHPGVCQNLVSLLREDRDDPVLLLAENQNHGDGSPHQHR